MNSTTDTQKSTWVHFLPPIFATGSSTTLFFTVLTDLFPMSIIALFLGIIGLIHAALVMLEDEHSSQIKKISLVSFIVSSVMTIISLLYFFHATAILESFGRANVIVSII